MQEKTGLTAWVFVFFFNYKVCLTGEIKLEKRLEIWVTSFFQSTASQHNHRLLNHLIQVNI